MTRILMPLPGAALAAFLAGCAASAPPPSAAIAPAGPPPVSGWLAGPGAPALDEADRQRAFEAELSAADTGRRASWRSPKGHFGLVEPGADGSGGSAACRGYAHTVYVDGRAQRGAGIACKGADGGWRIGA